MGGGWHKHVFFLSFGRPKPNPVKSAGCLLSFISLVGCLLFLVFFIIICFIFWLFLLLFSLFFLFIFKLKIDCKMRCISVEHHHCIVGAIFISEMGLQSSKSNFVKVCKSSKSKFAKI